LQNIETLVVFEDVLKLLPLIWINSFLYILLNWLALLNLLIFITFIRIMFLLCQSLQINYILYASTIIGIHYYLKYMFLISQWYISS